MSVDNRSARQPSADELMWLNFETKIRNVMRGMLEPVVDISTKDREGMLILSQNFTGLDDGLARLEEAIRERQNDVARLQQ